MKKKTPASKTRIGLALGSGSARGWGHIGVINALSELGIEPDIVCGCSVGSLVGASYCAGNLPRLEQWLRKLSKLDVARFFELNWSFNGFVDAENFGDFLTQYVSAANVRIEHMDKTFASVATELHTGREIWFTKGSVLQAVWASISLPGLFPPIQYGGKWLVDGGLVNPVPVSVCRALGADLVIAVNLNGDIVGRHLAHEVPQEDNSDSIADRFIKSLKEYSDVIFPEKAAEKKSPGLFDAIASSINITQDRITRSRMAGDPPDILLSPKLAKIGLLEFHRASEAIKEGSDCVKRMLPEIEYTLKSL